MMRDESLVDYTSNRRNIDMETPQAKYRHGDSTMPYDEARLTWTSSVNVSKAERVLIWASAIRAFKGSGTSFTTTTTTTTIFDIRIEIWLR